MSDNLILYFSLPFLYHDCICSTPGAYCLKKNEGCFPPWKEERASSEADTRELANRSRIHFSRDAWK
jgi:hypothetical protein